MAHPLPSHPHRNRYTDLLKPTEHMITAASRWLSPGHSGLQEAIEKTVSAGLFARHDIEFQLQVLRDSLHSGELEKWVSRAGMASPQKQKESKKILCLHAGNLPLVGFQSALAVLLSGNHYYGKISRKDPWLLPSFLEEVRKEGLKQHIRFSRELIEFEEIHADAVVFAGSNNSVPGVKKEVRRLNAAKSGAAYMIRTAKFSVAYVDRFDDATMKQLAEAVLQYGGRGCRSVGMIVSSFALSEVRESLSTVMEHFLEQKPQHQKPKPILNYQQALNRGVERPQIWLRDFLIQEKDGKPELDFCTHWIQGGPEKPADLKQRYGSLIQTVYTVGAEIQAIETEPLARAQRPPLWWKPDGVDVLKELIELT